MRSFLFAVVAIVFVSCSGKKNSDIFIRPINSSTTQVNVQSTSSDISFSDDLWKHITSNFQSASIELFRISPASFPALLSDTAYSFAMITNTNRDNLVKHLPKDLSIQESNNYTEETTMKLPGNAPDFVADTLKRKWEKASPDLETEYSKFYALIKNKTSDYIIIIRKSYLRGLLENMKAF